MKKEIKHEESSGNVFADLGIENPEEALAKSELTQKKASTLIRGRLRSFSLERLFRFLFTL
jgi:predicted XRE-type DNA-binding protein